MERATETIGGGVGAALAEGLGSSVLGIGAGAILMLLRSRWASFSIRDAWVEG